jgi:hypothetical protein
MSWPDAQKKYSAFDNLETRGKNQRGFTGSDLGERWPSRLVATAAEDRLSFRRNAHVVCGKPPIAEQSHLTH